VNRHNEILKNEEEANGRIYDMLLSSLGQSIQQYLNSNDIIEIMLNPDGKLWIDTLSNGRQYTGENMLTHDAKRIIRIVSSNIGTTINEENPILSAELPVSGARFQGIIPPIVEKPVFTIRKKAIKVYTLNDYINNGIIKKNEARLIEQAVKDKYNILIVGGTGSGKTTLANAILNEISKTKDRLVIIEDTLELQCNAKDFVTLRTNDNTDITKLLKASMRLRPDRIIVGEVRGGEALGLLKAWNTGHPGGLSTVHANGTRAALSRIEQLIQEAVPGVPCSLIADAMNIVLFIERNKNGRCVKDIAFVKGYDQSKKDYIIEEVN